MLSRPVALAMRSSRIARQTFGSHLIVYRSHSFNGTPASMAEPSTSDSMERPGLAETHITTQTPVMPVSGTLPPTSQDTAEGYAWLRKALKEASSEDEIEEAEDVAPTAPEPRFPLYPVRNRPEETAGSTPRSASTDRASHSRRSAYAEADGGAWRGGDVAEGHGGGLRAGGRFSRLLEAQSEGGGANDASKAVTDCSESASSNMETLKVALEGVQRRDKREGKPKPRVGRTLGTDQQSSEVEQKRPPALQRARLHPRSSLSNGSKPTLFSQGPVAEEAKREAKPEEREHSVQSRIIHFGQAKLEVESGGITFVGMHDPSASETSGTVSGREGELKLSNSDNTQRPTLPLLPPRHRATNRWLRDNCQCPECVQLSTGQKLRRSGDFGEAEGIIEKPSGEGLRMSESANKAPGLRRRIVSIGTLDGFEADMLGENFRSAGLTAKGEEGLVIEWEDSELRQLEVKVDPLTMMASASLEATPLPSHRTYIPISYLNKHLSPKKMHRRSVPFPPILWTAKELLEGAHLRVQYQDFMESTETLREALLQLGRYGLVILKGVPTERTSDADCELRRAMSRIGEIRNTFYGETWDVQAKKDSKNVAYTSVDLGLHQDLLYFENPPRYQALHCLRNKVEGGSSYFVDSFKAAEILYHSLPRQYHQLATNEIPYHYDNDGYHYFCKHKTIESPDPTFPELNRLGDKTGEAKGKMKQRAKAPQIHAINYSPPFQAPGSANDRNGDAVAHAMHAFDQILDSDVLRYEFTMEEGDLALFDNRRVLHARREFHDKPEDIGKLAEGDPTRWLKGCYLDGDVIWNKQRTLTGGTLRIVGDDDAAGL